jgi:hypothetical protein
MEGKLIKRDNDFYSLKVDGFVMATSNGMIVDYNLSLKNIQAIERGYDLDELAKQECIYPIYNDLKVSNCPINKKLVERGFKIGFQKLLDILGDKKFSEEDMIKCFNASIDEGWVRADFYIQSLQQTEWDVEIVMGDPIGIGDKYTPDTKPKLDENGCLILKRIKE